MAIPDDNTDLIALIDARIDHSFNQKLDMRFDERITPIRADVAELRTGFDQLRAEIARFHAEMSAGLEKLRAEMNAMFREWTQYIIDTLRAELAQHARAITESLHSDFQVLQEPYKDLPGRMTRVEELLEKRKPTLARKPRAKPVRRRTSRSSR